MHFSSILQINSLDMFFCFYMSFHITFSIALIVAMRNFSIFVYYFQITMKKYVDTNLWGLFQFEVKGRWITSFCKIPSILKENIKVESHISWLKISRGLQSNKYPLIDCLSPISSILIANWPSRHLIHQMEVKYY